MTASDGLQVEIAGAAVEAIRVEHGELETHGLRVSADGLTFAYSADSARCQALGRLANHADLFLCEAGTLDEASTIHLHPKHAGEIAMSAGVRRLALTHLRPAEDPHAVDRLARSSFDGDLVVVRDGLALDVPGPD